VAVDPVWTILILWIAFAVTHMGLSSQTLRPKLVGVLGETGFQGVYSLLALVIFVPLVSVYFENQHAGPHLWYLGPGAGVRWVVYLTMTTALALLVGGLIQPSPALMGGARSREARVRGVLRISRHPVFMGAGLFGLAHLFGANVNAAELAFFAGFPIFAVLGCAHQDRRKLASLGEPYRSFCDETALLPFGRGAGFAVLREAWIPIALAVGGALLLRSFHAQWFGGAA
jgi:uncharacterized membrane protein